MICYQGLVEYPCVIDFYKWFIIAGMKCGLDMDIVRPVVCVLLAAVMLALSCASPAQEPGFTDNISGGRSHWDKAVAEVTRAINIDPAFALAFNLSGLSYYYKGEYDRAIVNYDRAIELDPNLSLAYFNRGLVYDRQDEYDKAIADYTRVIELDPGYAQAYQHRALIYYNIGRQDKFQDDFNKAQELLRVKVTP